MASARVLVVDDEPALVEVLSIWLGGAGYGVVAAPDGQEGLKAFFAHQPALVVLDLLMPRMGGFELLRRIREVSEVPVIVLSAKWEEGDKVRALRLGADDYLVKPIGRAEMLARVEAVLRRAQRGGQAGEEEVYSDGALTVDLSRHLVYVRGEPVDLTATEYRLLSILVRSPRRAFSHDELLAQVWGPDYEGEDYVKWHVASLRRKIEGDPASPALLVTVRGMGYRYVPPPQSSGGSGPSLARRASAPRGTNPSPATHPRGSAAGPDPSRAPEHTVSPQEANPKHTLPRTLP